MRHKRLFITIIFGVAFAITTSAQEHRASVGVIADFGEKGSMVGPHLKYLFTNNISGQGMVLFGK